MARRKNSRANEREQNDKRMTMQERNNQSVSSENGMEAGRAERMQTAGARGDALAGDEGVDDPAMSAAHRDDMTETPMQGDKLSANSSNRLESQRSRRTNQRANDERFDEASEFSGRGGQKEGSRRESESLREGTGYTDRERSNTDDNSSENPLS